METEGKTWGKRRKKKRERNNGDGIASSGVNISLSPIPCGDLVSSGMITESGSGSGKAGVMDELCPGKGGTVAESCSGKAGIMAESGLKQGGPGSGSGKAVKSRRQAELVHEDMWLDIIHKTSLFKY
jgi:hypothetical protein